MLRVVKRGRVKSGNNGEGLRVGGRGRNKGEGLRVGIRVKG